jgi:metalloendopeptidase OMA1, mitochondrial
MKQRVTTLLLLGSIIAIISCATVPVTKRKQLNFISPSQELQLGLSSFEQIKKETPVSGNRVANDLVRRVGERIAAVAKNDLPDAKWEFVVFENAEPNAFALPGGKVGVNTGILLITRDEAGLATVIGHEVAHAAAHHGAERMSRQLVTQTGGQILGATLSSADPRMQALASVVYGLGSQVGVSLPHSREQESEADEIGLIYMAQAGYNPEAALDFWTRFAEATRASGGSTPWFLSTHPVTTNRITHLQELMPQAKAIFQRISH